MQNFKLINKVKQSGVTLIALVITVIVLLILAGITLNLALDENGIIRKAIGISREYEEAGKNEQTNLNEFQSNLYSILSGTNKETMVIVLSKEKLTLDRDDTETLTATVIPEEKNDKKIKWTSTRSDVAEVSEDGIVTAKAVGETEITAIVEDESNLSATCTVTVINPTIAKKAEPGAYIKYEVPEKEFTITSSQTGQDSDQKFKTSTYTGLWRVLYNDEEHGLQIISDDIVGDLTLGHADSDGDVYVRNEEDERKAKIAYNNLVSTLNTFSRYYINDKYAEKARCVGSNPITPDDNETRTEILVKSDYPLGSGNYDSGCILFNDFEKTARYDYSLLPKLGLDNFHGNSYWFAARIGYCDATSARFGAYWGGNEYSLQHDSFWAMGDAIYNDSIVSSSPYEHTHGVRPVITLKSSVRTSSGNGSLELPFVLTEN